MNAQSFWNMRSVYVVDGCRTPFLKAKKPGAFTASDLAVAAGKTLLNRQKIQANQIDQVILGCVMPSIEEANIARLVALRVGCGDHVPAFTVMRNCASGMQALDSAAAEIASGRSDLIMAGGTEAMSHAPILFNLQMATWLAQWAGARSFSQRFLTIAQFRPSMLIPVIGLLKGLNDPLCNMSMGQTVEELAYLFGINRLEMDTFAAQSHQRIAAAYNAKLLDEVVPLIDKKGRVVQQDDGYRVDSSAEQLKKLKPFFDKKFGLVTAGNSSQISDGACVLLLASAEAVQRYNLPVIGRLIDSQWAALNPVHMGLGPIHAATPLLQRHKLSLQELDCLEINEAFAGQVLACLAAWNDSDYCKKYLGLKKKLGEVNTTQLNSQGGAIAIGHPIGASGARVVLHAIKSLQAKPGAKGIASLCIGGGQGGAMLVESCQEVGA